MKTSWLVVLTALAPGCVLTNPTDPYGGMTRGLRHYSSGSSRSAATQPVQGPLTLGEAIRVALANNPEVAATAYDVDAAQAQRDLAAGQRLPSLHAVGGYNHYLDSQRLMGASENGEPGVFGRDIFAGDLVVTMPIFTGGRITSEIRAATLLQKSAERVSRERGAFLALFLTGIPIGVTVLIGLVVMMGGITSQGVVLLALAEEYRRDGQPPLEAIRKAAPIRVRPILMTQLTTVLGLVPLALNLGEGGDMLKPMAVAVIGGLLYSLLLTLLFLPAAYGLIRRRGSRSPAIIGTRVS